MSDDVSKRPEHGNRPVRQVTVKIRLDADMLAAFKATGKGWKARINAVLREAVQAGKV